MLARIRKLRNAGVLGINERNRAYVMRYNRRALYELVDDKVKTKRLAAGAHIAVPELYGLVRTVHDAQTFERFVEGRRDFVIKPAHGSGGNGVLVIVDRRRDRFIKANGTILDTDELHHHVANMLGGIYSLGGQVDEAIVEYRVRVAPIFEGLSYQGVPDIRTLVYRGVPVMSMLRLPTKQSDGRANLHQGAVGVGIDIQSGRTTLAVQRDRRIIEHPDYGTPLGNHEIRGWDELLLLAARCYDLAPLGYLGVDIVLDAGLGPLVLELNARPGLAIQIANGCGLRPRLDAVDSAGNLPELAEQRVALAKALLGRSAATV